MFSNTLFKKNSTYPWVYFFAPHLVRQRKLYAAFFSKLRKSRKAALQNEPCADACTSTLLTTEFKLLTKDKIPGHKNRKVHKITSGAYIFLTEKPMMGLQS